MAFAEKSLSPEVLLYSILIGPFGAFAAMFLICLVL